MSRDKILKNFSETVFQIKKEKMIFSIPEKLAEYVRKTSKSLGKKMSYSAFIVESIKFYRNHLETLEAKEINQGGKENEQKYK
jgi:lipoate-protein ligase A